MQLLLLGKEIADVCKAYPALHLMICARLVDDDKATQLCSTNMQKASPELRRAMVATLQDLIKELDPKPEPPPVQEMDQGPYYWHHDMGRGWGTYRPPPFWTGAQHPRGGPQPGTDPPPRSGRPFKEYGEAFKYEAANDGTQRDAVDAASYAQFTAKAMQDAADVLAAKVMQQANDDALRNKKPRSSLWVPEDDDDSTCAAG